MLTRRLSWQGKGQQVGEGEGLALSGSQTGREQRQSKQHRAGDYLSKAPFKEAKGPWVGLYKVPCRCPHTPKARGLIPGVRRLVF